MPVWALRRQLTCPACAVVLGEARYRRFPPDLHVTSPEGHLVQPDGVAVLLLRARAEVERAGTGAAGDAARDRLAFLERNWTELVYDLRCANGHSTLRTMPQLVRAVRGAPGEWADLRD
jgi:hypothetical protein